MKTEGIEAATPCDPATGGLFRVSYSAPPGIPGRLRVGLLWLGSGPNGGWQPRDDVPWERLVAIDHVQRAQPEPPKGATHVGPPGPAGQRVFFQRTAAGSWLAYESERAVWKTRAWMDESLLTELPKAEPETWDGRGMPPVGTVCEALFRITWIVVRIEWVGATQVLVALQKDGSVGLFEQSMQFRPYRSPEQLEAEKRPAAVDEMVREFIDYYGNPKGGEQYLGICERLYDAGYHK